MKRIAIPVYRPKAGREAELLAAVRDHLKVLRAEGLATDRAPLVMRAKDGSILEAFEWQSAQTIERAHSNPEVQKLWARFGEACEYASLSTLAEATNLFAEFEPITRRSGCDRIASSIIERRTSCQTNPSPSSEPSASHRWRPIAPSPTPPRCASG